MDHGGDSDRNSRLPDGPDAGHGARKCPVAPQQVVAVPPAVKTDLELLDKEPAGRFRCDECTVGKDNATQSETLRLFDEFPQVGIEERLSPRDEETQAAVGGKLPGNGKGRLDGQFGWARRAEVTVTAAQIAAVQELKFQVAE